PRRLVILIDLSASIKNPTLELEVANDVIAHMPESVEIGVLTFADKVNVAAALTKDHKKVSDGLTHLLNTPVTERTNLIGASTDLIAAVENAAAIVGAPQFGDSIFVLSDGSDNSSHTAGYEKVRDRLAGHGYRLFWLNNRQAGLVAGQVRDIRMTMER